MALEVGREGEAGVLVERVTLVLVDREDAGHARNGARAQTPAERDGNGVARR